MREGRQRQKQRRPTEETALNSVSGEINKAFKEHTKLVGNVPIGQPRPTVSALGSVHIRKGKQK